MHHKPSAKFARRIPRKPSFVFLGLFIRRNVGPHRFIAHMPSPQPIAAVNLDELAELEAAIIAQAGPPNARPQHLPASLEARRVALLASHLGYFPKPQLPLLHVVGDSHTAFFAGAERISFHKGRRVWTGFLRARYISAFTELLPVFRVFHVGPATAWQAHEPGSSTRAQEKIHRLLQCGDIPKASHLLLVFGEIDCRCQIPKTVLAGTSIEKATAATVERFMRLPGYLKKAGCTPSVWLPSLQPIASESNPALKNHPLPVIGPQSLRDEITVAYCARLKDACTAKGIRTSGLTPPPAIDRTSCFLDNHHLSQRMMPTALAALVQADILPLATAPTLQPR